MDLGFDFSKDSPSEDMSLVAVESRNLDYEIEVPVLDNVDIVALKGWGSMSVRRSDSPAGKRRVERRWGF